MDQQVEQHSFYDMAQQRWSVRRFKPEQISDEHLRRILQAGCWAPSACNYQPQRVFVLQSDAAIAGIRSMTHWAFNAPTVLVVCADLSASWKNVDGHDSAQVDAAIATTHMMMEAWELGVGSTWVRGFDERAMSALLGLPAHIKPVAMMPMGYIADEARPSSWHFRRRSVEELCTIL